MASGKYKLEVEYDYSFVLIGISSHEKPHRVAWALNKELELELERREPHQLILKKGDTPTEFKMFTWEHPDFEAVYSLFANKSGKGLLIPEQAQADYLLMAEGPFTEEDEKRMIASARNIPFVLMAWQIEAEALRSKQNLIL